MKSKGIKVIRTHPLWIRSGCTKCHQSKGYWDILVFTVRETLTFVPLSHPVTKHVLSISFDVLIQTQRTKCLVQKLKVHYQYPRNSLHYVAWLEGTTPDLAFVVAAGRQEGIIIFNSKWKCNQKIMKASQVFVWINLHFNPAFMVQWFNSTLRIKKCCFCNSTWLINRFLWEQEAICPKNCASIKAFSVY